MCFSLRGRIRSAISPVPRISSSVVTRCTTIPAAVIRSKRRLYQRIPLRNANIHICSFSPRSLARTDDNLRRLMPEIEWGEAEIAEHIAAPLTSALATLHLLGVHHRDIRPENILLSGTHATLCGFDRAKHPSPDDVPCASTLPYTAPEVLSAMLSDNPTPAPDAAALGPKADVYALGGVIYECLKHTPPFRGGTREEVVADMLRDESPCLSGLRCAACVIVVRSVDWHCWQHEVASVVCIQMPVPPSGSAASQPRTFSSIASFGTL